MIWTMEKHGQRSIVHGLLIMGNTPNLHVYPKGYFLYEICYVIVNE